MAKRFTKKEKAAFKKLSDDVKEALWFHGKAGTKVWVNEKGNVEVRVLSNDEINDLLEKQKEGTPIPEEFSIYPPQ